MREKVRAVAGHPALAVLRARQRDLRAARPLAWGRGASSAILNRLYRVGEAGRPGGAGHLCELPDHRIPGSAVSGFLLLQRLSGVSGSGSTAYLARLQNLAGDRPLIMAEIGLDSLRNGEQAQASDARLADRGGVRGGLCRRVRFRLDRRMVPRRARQSRTGISVSPTRIGARSPRSRPCDTLSPRCRSRETSAWPRISVVVCTLQRRAHDPRVSRGAAPTGAIPTSKSSSSMTARPTRLRAIAHELRRARHQHARIVALSTARNTGPGARPPATSSPTSTTTRIPTRTG